MMRFVSGRWIDFQCGISSVDLCPWVTAVLFSYFTYFLIRETSMLKRKKLRACLVNNFFLSCFGKKIIITFFITIFSVR